MNLFCNNCVQVIKVSCAEKSGRWGREGRTGTENDQWFLLVHPKVRSQFYVPHIICHFSPVDITLPPWSGGSKFTKHWYLVSKKWYYILEDCYCYSAVWQPQISIQSWWDLPVHTLFMVMIELSQISVRTMSICHSPNPCNWILLFNS